MKYFNIFIIIAMISTASYLQSCKKNNVAELKGYMKVKINDELKVYPQCQVFIFDTMYLTQPNVYMLSISGFVGDSSGQITLLSYSITPFAPNDTMTHDKIIPHTGWVSGHIGGGIDYIDNVYMSGMGEGLSYPVQIILTEIKKDYIKGTFNGQIKRVGGTEVLTLTDGEFTALRE